MLKERDSQQKDHKDIMAIKLACADWGTRTGTLFRQAAIVAVREKEVVNSDGISNISSSEAMSFMPHGEHRPP